MIYMLDTNICIYIIKKKPEKVLEKFKSRHLGDMGISSITFSELVYGVEKSQHQHQNKLALEQFVLPLDVVAYDVNAANCYSRIRASLEKQGTPIGALDMMIAAHAQSMNATLITNNVKEFSRIPHLDIQNWVYD